MSAVVRVALRQVYDSRGQPTVEAVTEGIRAILDHRYVAGADLKEPVR